MLLNNINNINQLWLTNIYQPLFLMIPDDVINSGHYHYIMINQNVYMLSMGGWYFANWQTMARLAIVKYRSHWWIERITKHKMSLKYIFCYYNMWLTVCYYLQSTKFQQLHYQYRQQDTKKRSRSYIKRNMLKSKFGNPIINYLLFYHCVQSIVCVRSVVDRCSFIPLYYLNLLSNCLRL